MIFCSAILSLLATTVEPDSVNGPTEVYAVIVANNEPIASEHSLRSLRYADDDGARFYEMFEMFAKRVVIHTVLDPESQNLHPEVARVSRVPHTSEVKSSLYSVFDDIREAKKNRRRTELFFVFIGHGSARENGEGIMHFLDRGFSRSDLFQEVIAPSPADINHIIVDACNAFLFVAGRGSESVNERIDRAVEQYLARETIRLHPNTGFLLSTSAATEVHEWSGFRAGIFSHEIRSALLGGADVDSDGAITYNEVHAFLQAANGRVRDPRAKIQPWVTPPAVRLQAPLVDQSRLPTSLSRVRVGGALAGRWFVEDERGVRVADVHVANDGPVNILLSPKRDHILRGKNKEISLKSSILANMDAEKLSQQDIAVRPRSTVATSFRVDLFAIPFGRAFFDGFKVSPPSFSLGTEIPKYRPNKTVRHWVGASIIASGIVALGAGGLFAYLAQESADSYRVSVGLPSEVNKLRDQARERELTANILLGTGIAAVAAGALVFVW